MKLPRRLCRTSKGVYCEEDHPDAAVLVGPVGMEIGDREAERLGILAYYQGIGVAVEETSETKEVKQTAFEDKALDPAPPEEKDVPPGLHIDHSARRGGITSAKK